jgi:hypothetical protein
VVSSTAALSPATKTPGHGVWSHLWDHTYAYGFKFFRFDATGALVGWTVIRQEAILDQKGDEYTAVGGAQAFDTALALLDWPVEIWR